MPLATALLCSSILASTGLGEPNRLLAQALGTGGTATHLEAAAGVVRIAVALPDSGGTVGQVLLALDHGLRGRTDVALPDALAAALERVPESPRARPVHQVRRLRIQLRTRDARARAVARGFLRYDDPSLTALRVEIVGVLGELAEPDSREAVLTLARDSAHADVRRAALLALQHDAEPGLAGRVLSFLPQSPEPEVAAELLSRRAPWARDLVRGVAEGIVPLDAVLPEHVERMRRFGDAELDLALAGLWGDAEQARALARTQVPRVLDAWSAVTASDAPPASLEHGRAVFASACARCHDGGRSGPPTYALPRDATLPAEIAEPGAYEVTAWTAWELVSTDGLRVTGQLVEDRAGVVTLQDTLGMRTTLRRADAARLEPIGASLMPAGLTAALGDADLRALLAWLASRPE